MEHKALYHIELPIDESLLIEESQSYDDYEPYYDTKNERYLDDWLQKHVNVGHAYDIAEMYKKRLDISDIRPRYYVQKNTFTLPWHKDRGTECSFNFVLGGSAPISFRDVDYHYKYAILNTQEEHAVFHDGQNEDRVLLKLSVFGCSFEETVKRYEHSLQYAHELSKTH